MISLFIITQPSAKVHGVSRKNSGTFTQTFVYALRILEQMLDIQFPDHLHDLLRPAAPKFSQQTLDLCLDGTVLHAPDPGNLMNLSSFKQKLDDLPLRSRQPGNVVDKEQLNYSH